MAPIAFFAGVVCLSISLPLCAQDRPIGVESEARRIFDKSSETVDLALASGLLNLLKVQGTLQACGLSSVAGTLEKRAQEMFFPHVDSAMSASERDLVFWMAAQRIADIRTSYQAGMEDSLLLFGERYPALLNGQRGDTCEKAVKAANKYLGD